ncbi:cell adhesion molecule CEACAM6-like isoform X2 [Pseudochaenichthys georgianus]|uniref:cell adhesion molecule CEACAM6-like isoform X2 n=1 Tax=Pseudochaenichthys georgianus TaxID=52239 RepID=UPI0039C3D8E6
MVTSSSTELVEFSSVRLSCSSSGSSLSFLWLNSSSEVTGSDRVQITDGGSTLTIANVTRYDQGPFRCRVSNPVSEGTSAPVTLSIYSPVSKVMVTSSSTELVEFNSSVSLSCSSSGSSLSFLWLKSNSEVTGSDRVQITDGGSTLTITNVTRYDQGPFSCRVSNPVSEGTSKAVILIIYYGPENVNLKISPPHKPYLEGSNISLSCSAVSIPSAHYTWFLNGGLLSKGSQFNLTNSQENQSGSYSCQAFNDKTLRYETSHPASISVLVQSGCSGGCIAGIVIGVFVVLGVVAAIVWYFLCYKKKQQQSSNTIRNNNKAEPQSDIKEVEEAVYENTSAIYENV